MYEGKDRTKMRSVSTIALCLTVEDISLEANQSCRTVQRALVPAARSQQADLTRMLELTLSFEDLPIQLILQAYTAIAQVSRASAGLHRVYASMDNKAKNRTRATTTSTFVRSEAWFRYGESALHCCYSIADAFASTAGH